MESLGLMVLLAVVGTSIWVLVDAYKIGARPGLIGGVCDLSPGAWFLCCLLLWIVAFPLYLGKRQEIMDAAQDPVRTIAADTGKSPMFGTRVPGKWVDPVDEWEKKRAPAAARIAVATMACPLCSRKIPSAGIRIGQNECPECLGVFEAEDA
jgi:hypothetical protein